MKVGSLIIYRIAVTFFKLRFAGRGGIEAFNADRIPAHGGVIIAPIHQSNLDPPALACTMPHRRLLALAKQELWDNKLFGWIVGQIGAFPIRRGEVDREAINYATAVLEAGHALLVFPEGTRGDGSHLQEIQAGAAMLAKRTGVPVVPVGIVGTLRGSKDRRVRVAYGEPFTYAEMAQPGEPDRETRRRFNDRLRRDIIALCRAHGLELETNQVPGAEDGVRAANPDA